MQYISLEQFNTAVKQAATRPRLARELRFGTSTAGLSADDWRDRELLAIRSRDPTKGVLLLQPYEQLCVVVYDLSPGVRDALTGRSRAVICDFCKTWQPGSGAASITFGLDKSSLHSVSFLCCDDLQCSRHVRNLTPASRASRAQLREDITTERRIERLRQRLSVLVADLRLQVTLG